MGTKVLWFGKEEEVALLKDKYSEFAKAFLLQAYATQITEQGIFVDGEGDQMLFEKIAEDCPMFNSAQYQVEHCKESEHIVVQASAGTGKTTVMIDRIMFLLHMHLELRLSEIFMITFTNDAVQQMENTYYKEI